jgi:hypothetical protein
VGGFGRFRAQKSHLNINRTTYFLAHFRPILISVLSGDGFDGSGFNGSVLAGFNFN